MITKLDYWEISYIGDLYKILPSTKKYDIGHYSGLVFRSTKTGKIGNTVTGQAQSAICIYCRKAISAWGKDIKLKGNRPSGSHKIWEKIDKSHVTKCASEWLISTLSRWSIGNASPEEHTAITSWLKKQLESNKGLWYEAWQDILKKLIASLPEPVGSPKTEAMELGLLMLKREMDNWPTQPESET